MIFLKQSALVFFGLCSGGIMASAVVAFISILKVVPSLAQKTGTTRYIKTYETAIIIGGLFSAIVPLVNLYLPIGSTGLIIVSFFMGIFYGCLAMSLAEVLNVIPILSRRIHLKRGMFFFVLAIALGKLTGSLLYYVVPGFIKG